MSLRPAANLPPVSLTPVSTAQGELVAKFAAGVVDIGGKFAAGLVDIALTCEYLCEFSKNSETVLMGYSGAGGKLIHKKTRSKKSRDTAPLMRHSQYKKCLRGVHGMYTECTQYVRGGWFM